MHQTYKDRGLAVVAINLQESKDTVAAWVKQKKISFTVLFDRDGAVSGAYQVTNTPTVYIVGKDGKVVGKALGNKEWTSPKGRALLEALLTQ